MYVIVSATPIYFKKGNYMMKKFLSVLLVAAMIASMLIVSASAADDKVYNTYAEAAKGDLLWQVDFNNKAVLILHGRSRQSSTPTRSAITATP